MKFTLNVGDKAKDKISGMTGIVTSRAEHLYGCNRYWLSPQELKDGKPVDGCWFDEDSLELLQAAAIKPQQYRVVDAIEEQVSQTPLRRAGGPTSQPSSHGSISTR